ncbi:MAG: BMP family ABC transporter substrate-binding protein, partial [Eubacteriales bacterium]
MKKLLAILLAAVMIVCFAACTSVPAETDGKTDGETDAQLPAADDAQDSTDTETNNAALKVGVILVGDENEGYTYAHIKGIQEAAKELGLTEDQIIWKYSIPEDATCTETALDLADQGCNLIISNSYGHQPYMQEAAKEVPEAQFVAMTGDTAANSGLDNFSNAFTYVYESRYVSGVVAGMKLAELVAEDKLSDANYDGENIKIGYVGAYPYAEVVSGYTAFFLGIQSIVPNVTM